MKQDNQIIIFDGFCNFCSGSVRFILKRDQRARFRFAASQQPAGQRILAEHGMHSLAAHSIILLDRGKIYSKSGAVLRIARGLGGIWPLFYGLILLPRGVRDFLYDRIARLRYRLFGRRKTCFLPGEKWAGRFLED